MFELSDPDNGWIDLFIADSVKYSFSDVGPDTIGQLEAAVIKLHNEDEIVVVNCNLEPAELDLEFSQSSGQTNLRILVDGAEESNFSFPTKVLASAIDREIAKVKPLCTGRNWTR